MRYRATNKRLIARGPDGKFRRETIPCCEACGAIIFRPYLDDLPRPIDPQLLRRRQQFCPRCDREDSPHAD